MHISPTIHDNAGHNYNNTIRELMYKFSPWEDFFVNPFSSDVISYVCVHVHISVQVLVEAHAVEQ